MPPEEERKLVLTLRLPKNRLDSSENIPWLPFELRIFGNAAMSTPHWVKNDWENRDQQAFIFFSATPDSTRLDFRVGVPADAWQDTDAGWEWNGNLPRHPERVIRRSGQQAEVTLLTRGNPSRQPILYWDYRSFPADWIGRIVAVDKAGVVHNPKCYQTSLRGPGQLPPLGPYELTFDWLSFSQIKELRFQIRRCRWVEFRNLSLQPGRQTQVEIVDAEKNAQNK